MKRLLYSILAIIAAGCMLESCGNAGKTAGSLTNYDVYLLIGQSNMAGRGTMIQQDTINAIEGVWLLGPEGTPVPARNPLNRYSTIRKTIKMQQICPGTGFSETMYAHNGRKILLVMNARGGTALDEWAEGTQYYNEAVRRCKEGMKYGTLKGILWHQGCADSGSETKCSTYLDRLAPMVKALRRDLGVGRKVPFIAGELGRWWHTSERFNQMIHGISDHIPNSSWVSSEGCGSLKGEKDAHFSREGQLLLGRRYAEKLLEMTEGKR